MKTNLERWAIVLPWCVHLKQTTSLLIASDAPGESDVPHPLVVHVLLDGAASHDDLRKCREAIELLGVIATVDNQGWQALLTLCCGCVWGDQPADAMITDDLPPRFLFQFHALDAPNGEFDTVACRTFFAPFDAETTRAEFKDAIRDVYHSTTPTEREVVAQSGDREYPTTLVFSPPKGIESSKVDKYLESVRSLVMEIVEQSANRSRKSTVNSERNQSAEQDLISGFRLKLHRGELNTDAITAKEIVSSATVIVDLVALGVEVFPGINLHYHSPMVKIPVVELGRMVLELTNSHRSEEDQAHRVFAERKRTLHIDNSTKEGRCLPIPFRRFQVLCSALISAQAISKLHVDRLFKVFDRNEAFKNWQWLSYALFSKDSCSSVESVTITDEEFTAENVQAILSVLNTRFPVRKLMDRCHLQKYFEQHLGSDEEDQDNWDSNKDDEHSDDGSKCSDSDYSEGPDSDDSEQTDDPEDIEQEDSEDDQLNENQRALTTALAEFAEVFARKSDAWYRIGEIVYSDETFYGLDDHLAVDDDAGSVFLKQGTTVFINPFDSIWEEPIEPELLMIKKDEHFRILRNDQRVEWIDIMIPGYGHCAALRDFTERVVMMTPNDTEPPRTSLEIGYSGPIRSLELSFETLKPAPSAHHQSHVDPQNMLLQFFEYLGPQLETLKLGFKVSDNPEHLRRILKTCPRLTKLEVNAAPAGVLTMLVRDVLAADKCQIEELCLLECPSGQETVALIEILQGQGTPIAKKLQKLSLNCSPEVSLGENVIAAVELMLQVNTTLEYISLDVSPTMDDSTRSRLLDLKTNALPVVKTLLPLDSRCAFLSVVQQKSYHYHKEPSAKIDDTQHAVKRQRLSEVRSVDLSRLDRDAIALIFLFAAEPKIRVVELQSVQVDDSSVSVEYMF